MAIQLKAAGPMFHNPAFDERAAIMVEVAEMSC
jgi:hypothetical protein